MAFATIRDHVGGLESKRLKGGITLPVFVLLSTACLGPLFCMYCNSCNEIWWLRSGVLETADTQTSTQRNPHNPNMTNGPNIPPLDIRIGESVSPIALPSWNPAIASPTALERSVWGNHLKTNIERKSSQFWSYKKHSEYYLADDDNQINSEGSYVLNIIPRNHIVHAGQSHAFSNA